MLLSQKYAASVLERRLNEVLRFSLGRTYGVSVQDNFSSAPPMVKPSQPLPGTVMVRVFCLHACVCLGQGLGLGVCGVKRFELE